MTSSRVSIEGLRGAGNGGTGPQQHYLIAEADRKKQPILITLASFAVTRKAYGKVRVGRVRNWRMT